MEKENQKQYLRRPGAAEYLDVSERTISDWQKRRIIPFFKVGRKCVLFSRGDLDRAIAKFTVKSIGAPP
ncbi:MAG: helix-turn-helix domain-containing protein [Verrucomicrobia bacterium]|nr:helix-turn-helix domain-containing protein [Verrucomicrobiota bacterium]MBU4428975.1 helix-turn-helix domain-containing protein [Verrucomicrobiota bacterium]MCG2680916.1 helix-turn-helix domain-containing protein [Kiritimatiellia bacterium]